MLFLGVICRKPIEQLDYQRDKMFFVPLEDVRGSEDDMKQFAENIQKLRALVSDELEWRQRRLRTSGCPESSVWRKFFEAVEMKPGIAGFRVDLKKRKRGASKLLIHAKPGAAHT